MGQEMVGWLNKYYSLQEGKPSTYDWCGCGKKNTAILPRLTREADSEPISKILDSLLKKQ
jgi:hypothetical protein